MFKPYLNFNKNNNIFKQLNIKQIILDFIYSNVNLANIHQYDLNKKSDIYNLFNNCKYIIQPYLNGLPCLCIILRHRNNFYSCLVEKQNLKPNPNDNIINEIDMFHFNISFSNIKIYNGTILDGIYKYNDNKEEFFIVNDIYKLNGDNLINDNLINKFINFKSYINHFGVDNFHIYINNYISLYDYDFNTDINDLLHCLNKENIDNSKTSIDIKNIINGYKFLSYKTGKVINYKLNNSNQLFTINKNNICDEKFIYNNQKVKQEKILTFLCVDCKDLYLREPVKNDLNEGKIKSVPYFICKIVDNNVLLKNKKKTQMIDCKITNVGIIPLQTSIMEKPSFLSELIEIIE